MHLKTRRSANVRFAFKQEITVGEIDDPENRPALIDRSGSDAERISRALKAASAIHFSHSASGSSMLKSLVHELFKWV